MIYLDNAATTPMFKECLSVIEKYACQDFFNPSAVYNQSFEITKVLDGAREQIMKTLGATKGSVIFTGGATESNNLAIMGSKRNGKWNYVFSQGEHPSVYNVAKELEMQGYEVRFVKLRNDGQVDYEQLEKTVDERTRLISVMNVSNETGAINDIKRIDGIRKQFAPKALLQVDGVQAFCKIKVNMQEIGADFYTISAHKFHGPKGVGALYVKDVNCLKNIVFGGGQEKGFRSGTENVAGVMAMISAIKQTNIEENLKNATKLKNLMISILERDEKIEIIKTDSPYILSVGFVGVNGETLMRVLQDKGVLVGIGSACSAKKSGNRILESMGLNKERIKSHLRISFDANQSLEEIKVAGEIILECYNEIWEKVK